MEKEREVFTNTIHCQSGSHCGICRKKVGGHGWRRSLMSLFVLPNNEVDFICPYGKSWAIEPKIETNGATNKQMAISLSNGQEKAMTGATENIVKKKGCDCKRKKK